MGDSGALAFVDARTGATAGTLALGSHKPEASAIDGSGRLYVADQENDRVILVDLRQHRVTATWGTTGCTQPTGMSLDGERRRLFVGCRGNSPVLAVIDADTGHVVGTYPIGRGNDGVVYDGDAGHIYLANGVDGNLVVYDQKDPDHYQLAEVVTTRPYARTLAFDRVSKRMYTVAAEGVYDPARPTRTDIAPFYPNQYVGDTLTVLTYAPGESAGGPRSSQ
jgi:DNA-binding beta-propeller fold protein YncE